MYDVRFTNSGRMLHDCWYIARFGRHHMSTLCFRCTAVSTTHSSYMKAAFHVLFPRARFNAFIRERYRNTSPWPFSNECVIKAYKVEFRDRKSLISPYSIRNRYPYSESLPNSNRNCHTLKVCKMKKSFQKLHFNVLGW